MSLLRAMLFDNLGLKLAALLLALLVYLNVYLDRPQRMTMSFPLQMDGLADTLSLSGSVPSVVQAEMHGSGKQLLRVRVTEPPVRVSLEGIGPGRFERALTADDLPITPSENLQVDRLVGPLTLQLTLERRETRRIPVAPRVEGAPAGGLVWRGEVTATPEAFDVTGPHAALAGLDSVVLRPVRIEGRRDTVRSSAMPEALPEWCTASPASVELVIPLVRGAP